nr:dual specificity protein phosphatase 19 [Hymenolepis microstoma]
MDQNGLFDGLGHIRLRPTRVLVRTSDGRVSLTDRNGNVISTTTDPTNEISQYGYIVNNNPDLQIGSQDAADDLSVLQLKGITHIVNLISNILPNKFPDQFEYLSCVLYDDLESDLSPIIDSCCDFIKQRVEPVQGRIFIFCNAGVSRAPSVLMGCLIKLHQLSYDSAYELLNNARNISPNLNFKVQLRSLASHTLTNGL